MSASNSGTRWVLGACLVVAVWGWMQWRASHEVEQRDLKQELWVRSTVGQVDEYRREHGHLPPGPNPEPEDPALHSPVSYRLVDATHFDLGVSFVRAQAPGASSGLGPSYAHPAGHVWYRYDASRFDPKDPAGSYAPIAVDPPAPVR